MVTLHGKTCPHCLMKSTCQQPITHMLTTSYQAKQLEKFIRSKACAHYLLLYALLNLPIQVTSLPINKCKFTSPDSLEAMPRFPPTGWARKDRGRSASVLDWQFFQRGYCCQGGRPHTIYYLPFKSLAARCSISTSGTISLNFSHIPCKGSVEIILKFLTPLVSNTLSTALVNFPVPAPSSTIVNGSGPWWALRAPTFSNRYSTASEL